jgi:hypothetical protein
LRHDRGVQREAMASGRVDPRSWAGGSDLSGVTALLTDFSLAWDRRFVPTYDLSSLGEPALPWRPTGVGKGCRSGLLSRQKYTTEQTLPVPVLLCDVSKQQVTRVNAEGPPKCTVIGGVSMLLLSSPPAVHCLASDGHSTDNRITGEPYELPPI